VFSSAVKAKKKKPNTNQTATCQLEESSLKLKPLRFVRHKRPATEKCVGGEKGPTER